jgi:hypothetical protein
MSEFRHDPSAMIRQLPTSQRTLSCAVDGNDYSGDWFQSRSVQGQIITAVRPTRAEILLRNPDEAAAEMPPRILSQIPGTLDRVYFQSAGGKVFRADDVAPGHESTMRPIDLHEATSGLKKDFFEMAGPRLQQLGGYPSLEKGWFYGLSKTARNSMLPTLTKIRWADDRALYLCPAAR